MKAIIFLLLFTGLYAQNHDYFVIDGDTIYFKWYDSKSTYYAVDTIRIPPPDTVEVFMLVSVVNVKHKTISGPFAVYGYEVWPAWVYYSITPDTVLTASYLTSEKKMIPHNWVIWRAIRKTEWENTWY